ALDRRGQAAVTVTGVAAGDARLRAGGRIAVSGLAEPLAGEYVLTEAVHTVDAAGYLTTLSTAPPEIAAPPAEGSAVTLGVVTEVDDPDNLGRVRVSLLSHGEADVGWLGVLCPGAGQDKGLVVLPDTGDTVLVCLPHGAVGGIVLGSLYGGIEPPDSGVHNGSVRRWSLRTADGQSVTVDDSAHRVTVADRAGSVVDLAPGQVTLHAATDLLIQAPGRAITVRARTVDFVHAPSSEAPPAGPGPQGGR
ncbi:MAG: phage baseplate assembly protein V, partial [Haloechinothrix sp.]